MSQGREEDLMKSLLPEVGKNVKFGDSPVVLRCHLCREEIRTYVIYDVGTRAWTICAGLCLLGCWFGCCLLPFCTESLQEARHFCSHCHKEVNFGKKSNE